MGCGISKADRDVMVMPREFYVEKRTEKRFTSLTASSTQHPQDSFVDTSKDYGPQSSESIRPRSYTSVPVDTTVDEAPRSFIVVRSRAWEPQPMGAFAQEPFPELPWDFHHASPSPPSFLLEKVEPGTSLQAIPSTLIRRGTSSPVPDGGSTTLIPLEYLLDTPRL